MSNCGASLSPSKCGSQNKFTKSVYIFSSHTHRLSRLAEAQNIKLHEDWRLLGLTSLFATIILLRLYYVASWPSWWWYLFSVIPLYLLWYFKKITLQHNLLFAVAFLALTTASYRMETVPKSAIERETFASIIGIVKRLELRPNKPTRLTLHVTNIDNKTPILNADIQLYVRTQIPEKLKAGDTVSTLAVFNPMNGPIVPGGFNFAQYSLLNNIVAQGFTVSKVQKIATMPREYNFQVWLENFRTNIAQQISKHMEPINAGIAVSLITGQRHYLDSETNADLRDTGLSHLLAISGLHMGLLTAAAFALFELAFASISVVALRYSPKKLAAILSWMFACIYLMVSGGSTATIRAFIMVSVAILAVLTDRRVVSLRSVALAAFIVLLIDPAALLSVSFHMSFAATTALVLAFEHIDAIRRDKRRTQKTANTRSLFRTTIFYILATAGTTLIAQIAVAPFALYHFQALSLVGLLTNIIAIPIMAFIVMPAAFLSLLFILIGIEPFPLIIMEYGLEVILYLVQYVRGISEGVFYSLPYHSILLPASGVCIVISCVMSGRNGLLFWSISVPLALVLLAAEPADILIDNGGTVIAYHIDDEQSIAIVGGRRGGFRDEAWKNYWGVDPEIAVRKIDQKCDTRACLINIPHNNLSGSPLKIIRSNTLETTRVACSAGAVVIASYRHKNYCREAGLFLAAEDIKRYGPVGLWLQKANNNISPDNQDVWPILKVRWSTPLPVR